MSDHLPDCDDYAFSGAGFHFNCERICICRQVRRIEKRILNAALCAVIELSEVSDRGWYALDDAIVAIERLKGDAL